jgi:polyphosphate glucokinase
MPALDDTGVSRGPCTLSIDIGGTGTKMLVLDDHGRAISPRTRRKTPRPADPVAVLRVIARMLAKHPPFDRVSVGFPGVVQHGVVRTAANLGTSHWQGYELQGQLYALVRQPVRVVNDADLQGYGVMRGAGVELVLTLGTGVGSALFTNGHLVPNLELAHQPYSKGRTYEQCLGNTEYKRIGKRRWRKRVARTIEQLRPIWNYDTLYVGGGNARYLPRKLPDDVHLFENVQGLTGGVRLWSDDVGRHLWSDVQ